jgi:hypothetical protein
MSVSRKIAASDTQLILPDSGNLLVSNFEANFYKIVKQFESAPSPLLDAFVVPSQPLFGIGFVSSRERSWSCKAASLQALFLLYMNH